MKKSEFCIMPESEIYQNKRYAGLERHEIFFGSAYRTKSINDGLVVFLTPEQHRGTTGIHGRDGHGFDLKLKKLGQKAAMEYYGWSTEEFRQRYGMNYL